MKKNASLLLILLVIGFSFSKQASANPFSGEINLNVTSLSGMGSIIGSSVHIQCDNYDASGSLRASEECFIKTKTLEGNGTIEGDKVTIHCDEFKFRGKISAQKCIIYTKIISDYNMFERSLEGNYTINISKYGFESCTYESLFSSIMNHYLDFAEKNIEDEIKRIRNHAIFNKIDDVKLLEALKKALKEKASYYIDKIDEKRGPSEDLYAGILCGTLGIGGISVATAGMWYQKFLMEQYHFNELTQFRIATFAVLFAGCSSFISYIFLSNWLNPRCKERYEKLSLILSAIDQSLMKPLALEQEVIVLQ